MSLARNRAWALCTLLAGTLACGRPHEPELLVGTWEGSSQTLSSVVMAFGADGRFRLEYVDATGAARRLTGEYEADFSKRPIPVALRSIKQLSHSLHTIVEFQGADSLRVGSFSPRWKLRPVAFDPAMQLRLERQSRRAEP